MLLNLAWHIRPPSQWSIVASLLLLKIALLLQCANGSIYDDSHDVLVDWSTAMSAAADGMDKLGMLSKAKFATAKMSTVAAFMAQIFKLAYQPTSDEVKAIEYLHTEIKQQFANVDAQLSSQMDAMQLSSLLDSYQREIILRMESLTSDLMTATDPYIWEKENPPSVKVRRRFTNQCTGDHSPIEMLRYINLYFNRNCRIRAPKDFVLHADAIELFLDFERQLEPEKNNFLLQAPHYHKWKNEMIEQVSNLHWKKGRKALKKLHKALFGIDSSTIGTLNSSATANDGGLRNAILPNTTHLDLLSMFASIKSDLPINNDKCFPKILVTSYKHERKAINDMAAMLHAHVGKIELLALLCSNVSNDGDIHLMNQYMRQIDEMLADMSNRLQNWAHHELENFWPLHVILHARTDIEDVFKGHHEITDRYEFPVVALYLRKKANQRGLAKYRYQVHVTEGVDNYKYYHYECDKQNVCRSMRKYRGMNILIARFDVEEEYNWVERMNNSYNWMETMHENITNIIADNAHEDDPGKILYEIDRMSNWEFKSGKYYRTFVVVHKSTIWGTNCVIGGEGIAGDYGLHEHMFSYNITEYYTSPFYRMAERYKIYAFL